jgi:hypothetical protein
MSGTKISALATVTTLSGTERVPLQDGPANEAISTQNLLNLAPRPSPLVLPGSSGSWITPDVATLASNTLVLNTLYLSPLDIWEPMTIANLAFRAGGTVAGLARLAMYSVDRAASQLVFVDECNTDLTPTVNAIASAALVAPQARPRPELLMLAMVCSAGPAIIGWSGAAAGGGGMQRLVGQDDPASANMLSTAAGFARLTAGALTFSSYPAALFPATIPFASLVRASGAPGSPVILARRSV